MEKYAVPVPAIGENANPITRSHWKRSLVELNGKFKGHYRHDVSPLLMQSYSEIGAFPHTYHIQGGPCETHIRNSYSLFMINGATGCGIRELGVSALEFDKQGIYLASVTRSGCLTVHDFESLYCQSNQPALNPKEDESKQLLHISLSNSIDAVRWNPANQDEVACTSLSHNEVHIFDIGYISSEPTEVLRKRPTVTVHVSSVRKGLTDIALLDDTRVLASDTCGAISIWDRRAGDLPQTGLTTNLNSSLTSIQLNGDQCVYGASKSGFIYIWDLRGGRSSAAFQSHKEVHSSPMISLKLASMLNKIELLKAQSNILPKEIQSIDINPSCSNQLGFHLDDGWSGVLDMHNLQVTHIHCPPPPWLEETNADCPISLLRKPSWLPAHSVYAVGSSSSNGLHLLDFYPNRNSPCHVDYDELKERYEPCKQNKLITLSGRVTACATHPLNGTIVVGTLEASLLMISQKHLSWNKGDDDDKDHK
ncbi:hypothetical protein LXL04_012985 [Taraxacum kok-saghyz]